MKTSTIQKTRTTFALSLVLMISGMSFATDGVLSGTGISSNPYEIYDAEDLKAFAAKVNNDDETSAFAILKSDICLNACTAGKSVLLSNGLLNNGLFEQWTPIGSSDKAYTGTFDGDGHSIRGLYYEDKGANDVGLFKYTGVGAVVRNLVMEDSYIAGKHRVGSIVGYNNGTVSDVYNKSTVEGMTGIGNYAGGIVGYNNGTVKNVYNKAAHLSGGYVGGIVGYNATGASVNNAYNNCTWLGDGGGIAYYNGGSIKNVFQVPAVGSGVIIAWENNGTISNAFYILHNNASANVNKRGYGSKKNVRGLTFKQLANLKVDDASGFPLLNGETESPWSEGGIEGSLCKYPYITSLKNFSADAQLQTSVSSVTIRNVADETDIGTIWHPTNTKMSLEVVQADYAGILKLYKDVSGVMEWDFDNDKVTKNMELMADYINKVDGVYQISSARDLKNFAATVNAGNYDASAVLTKDICLNACGDGESVLKSDGTLNSGSFETWIPIGTTNKMYRGKFDGQYNTISGLYFNDATIDTVGLFGHIYEGQVRNLRLADSYINGKNYVGGVVGYNQNGSVNEVYNSASVSGTSYVGGIAGYNKNSISNIINTGSVSGTSNVGGVVGYNYNEIRNVYSTGSVSGTSNVGGVAGYNYNSGSNGYFYNKTGELAAVGGGMVSGNGMKRLAINQLAELKINDDRGFPLLKDETESPWTAGGINGSICEFPYITGFGEESQIKYNTDLIYVTILDVYSGTKVASIALESASMLSKQEIESSNDIVIFNLYKTVGGENVEWNFESDVVAENTVLKAKSIGKVGNTYQIGSASELKIFAELVNDEGKTTASAVLTNDICLNACGEGESLLDAEGSLNTGSFDQWMPIGKSDKKFNGKFDGQNHTISGLYFYNEDVDNVGLFGHIDYNAKIQNLGVVDSYFKGKMHVGAIVARSYNSGKTVSTISNVYNTGTVIGTSNNVGGIVGCGYGNISNAYNMGTVIGLSQNVGGVAGYNADTISNAYNTGSVSGTSQNVGGVVGYNNGPISVVYNTGSVVSDTAGNVGGVVGYADTYSNVDKAYNTGSVSGASQYVGGIVGNNDKARKINNAYNTGSVSGASFVGGVAGRSYNSYIRNVYNTGSVSGKYNVGAIAGTSSVFVYNAYFDTTVCSGIALGSTATPSGIVKGLSMLDLANLKVADESGFPLLDGESESPWTTGSKVTGDGFVTYKFPYLTAFGESSQPIISIQTDFGAVTISEDRSSATVNGSFVGAVNIPDEIKVSGAIAFDRSFPNLTAGDAFSTIMLPFEPASKPTGVSFYTLGSVSKVNGKWAISATEVTGALDANTPYLVKVESGTKSITFEDGGTFKKTEGEHSVTNGNWKFVGTYEYKTWPENDPGIGKTYGFAGSNGNDASIVGKFAKVGAGAYIYPMRAYLEYSAPARVGRPAANGETRTVASLPNEIDVLISEKDETTGEQTTRVIGTLNTRTGEFKAAADRYFDMKGRYLGVKKPTAKGTYYNNGKKVIVK